MGVHALDRIGQSQGGHPRPVPFRTLNDGTDQLFLDQRPRAVLHQHQFAVIRQGAQSVLHAAAAVTSARHIGVNRDPFPLHRLPDQGDIPFSRGDNQAVAQTGKGRCAAADHRAPGKRLQGFHG